MITNDVIFRAIKLYKNLVKNSMKLKNKKNNYSCEKMNIGVYTFLFCLMPILEKLDEYDLKASKFKRISLKELEKSLNISFD